MKVEIVKMVGRYDMTRLFQFREQIFAALNQEPEKIGFDCFDLEYVDSSTIGTLVQFFKVTIVKKVNIVFFGLSDVIRDLFVVTHLSSYFCVMSEKEFLETIEIKKDGEK